MNSARPRLRRLLTRFVCLGVILGAIAGVFVGAVSVSAWAQQAPAPPTPPRTAAPAPPAGASRPAPPAETNRPAGANRPAPVVAAPQKPNAQRPAGAAQPAAPLPAPPVPPSDVPAPQAQSSVPEPSNEPAKGASTGHPLPRFASLRSDDVNFRVGPGTRYPIEWTYKRKDLPILIERELDVWRLVRDPEGTRGWVHVATLTTRRSFMVTGGERTLRRSAAEDASAVARLQAGVIGFIRSCKADAAWCQLQVGEYRGWLKRSEFWGALPGEQVN